MYELIFPTPMLKWAEGFAEGLRATDPETEIVFTVNDDCKPGTVTVLNGFASRTDYETNS